jgi:NAD(P)-dependent dehydrogenase (short-subunit alcohol dehydrogenase family)
MADLAVILGATGGLGTSIVDTFAKRGDRVVAVARSRAAVSELAAKYQYPSPAGGGGQGGGVIGETADLTSRLAVDDLWERIDRIGVPRWVVNATGGFRGGKLVDSAPDDFTFMMDLNLGSAWWSCRAAARRMAQPPSAPQTPSPSGAAVSSPAGGGGQGGGSRGIVNVASRSALVAEPGAAAYAVAKAGVIKLTEVLAAELKASGVRVNVVVPAIIDTPANRQSMSERLIARAVPPGEIADVIAYLCSDASEAITGAAIPVYGRF